MSEAAAENQPGSGPAPGQLSLWDTVSIITGIVIGVTIFKVPWLILLNVSDPWTGLLVWVFGGFIALVGGLCYAELATSYPRSGGDYVYLTRAYGPWVGFLFGWAQLAVILTASIGAMAFVFAENATSLYDLRELGLELAVGDLDVSSEFLYAVIAVLVIALLNIVGVKAGKWTQNLLTFAKVLGVGAIIVAGLFWVQSSPMDWRFAEPNKPGDPWYSNIGWGGLAMILVMYAYGGWNDAAFVASEVRNGKRNIPLALILGIGLITLIYVLVNAAYLVGLGFEGTRTPGGGGSTAFGLPQKLLEGMLPDFGGRAITVIIMISALGAVNGLTFTGARVYATLGNDYPLFGWLGHWKAGRGTPVFSLLVQAVITLAMIAAVGTSQGHATINQVLDNQMLRDIGIEVKTPEWKPDAAFTLLVDYSAPVFWSFFLLTGMSLFILRTKDVGIARPFTVPLYPLLPIIFCNMCVYMLYSATTYVGYHALFGVGLVLLGVPLYLLSQLAGGYREQPSSQ